MRTWKKDIKMLHPYTNYHAVARTFGEQFADELIRFSQETREAMILAVCRQREADRQRRTIMIDRHESVLSVTPRAVLV